MKKVLIANRGEIAVRIIRGCADYGVASVAIYADGDAQALHVQMADEAYALDGTDAAQTYLHIEKILALARRSGADAVHPGYGFLSENAAFAQAVQQAGLIWIGPSPAAIAQLGDKVQARRLAAAVGAPLVQGTAGPVSEVAEVLAFVQTHGLPIAIKAAYGGGGRGLKVVREHEEIASAYASAVREATAAFGRGECYVEQFLDRPRHIEAQVMADTHGQVVVLGTRDCSLQRRNQKLVEEAPAPFLSAAVRTRIHDSAAAICRAAGYTSAGTVEFLLTEDGVLSFLEVNTRLQVEHPVTEAVTGIDLVLEQLRIADGLPLSVSQTPSSQGHAFEFRINAEDVGRGFLPCPGVLTRFVPPAGPGVRVDSGVCEGATVSGHFDSLMAKLIVSGASRAQALARARRALREFQIDGVATVLPFHQAVLAHPDFVSETTLRVHTRWIETSYHAAVDAMPAPLPPMTEALTQHLVEIDGKRVRLGLPASWLRTLTAARVDAPSTSLAVATPVDERAVLAPIAGQLQRWLVEPGETVQAGQAVAVMTAMKMEMQVVAPRTGVLIPSQQAGAVAELGAILGRVD